MLTSAAAATHPTKKKQKKNNCRLSQTVHKAALKAFELLRTDASSQPQQLLAWPNKQVRS